MKLCVILNHYSSPLLPPCKDSRYMYFSAAKQRLLFSGQYANEYRANSASKNLETISCNTRYMYKHVGEFLWFRGKPL